MKHYYEIFLSANEDWMQSSVMLNLRHAKKGKRSGKYVWKRYVDLVAQSLNRKLKTLALKPKSLTSEPYD